MSNNCEPQQNHILRALNPQELAQLTPYLELITVSSAEIIYEMNEKLQYAYFPTTATASLLCALEDGTSVQVAMVGNEGVLGISLLMGGKLALTQAMIHSAGYCYRISTKSLKEAINRSGGRRVGTLQQLLQRYAQALIMEMAQTTACNRRHSVEQQFCRWLLVNFDRMQTSSLTMTHELIANMLGVRRESITDAARKLQASGVINYHRGHIDVIDRDGLEDKVCECYSILKSQSVKLIQDLHVA